MKYLTILSSISLFGLTALAQKVSSDSEFNAFCPDFDGKERALFGSEFTYHCGKYPTNWQTGHQLPNVKNPTHCAQICTLSDDCVGAEWRKDSLWCFLMFTGPTSLSDDSNAIYMDRTDSLSKCQSQLGNGGTPGPDVSNTKKCKRDPKLKMSIC